MVLEEDGYRVRGAKNGSEALDVLQKEGMPHLILLDMRMPVMDGWQFAAEFRARYDHKAPIIVMTAAGDSKQRAEDVQAEGWLGKPFRLDDLSSTVKRHIR